MVLMKFVANNIMVMLVVLTVPADAAPEGSVWERPTEETDTRSERPFETI